MGFSEFVSGIACIILSVFLALFSPVLGLALGFSTSQGFILFIISLILAFILFVTGLYYTITGLFRDEIIIKQDSKDRNREEKKIKDKNVDEVKDEKTNEKEHDVLKTLKIRYAKGEITRKQYLQMKKDLM